MTRSHKNSSSRIFKNIKKTTEIALPVVGKGLNKVGVVAKDVAVKSVPVLEKGVSSVYGTLATGFNFGTNKITKGVSKIRRSKKHGTGGRKSRKH